MLALPKKRPLFVEEDGGGGSESATPIESSALRFRTYRKVRCLPWARETGAYCMCDACWAEVAD